MIYGTCIYVEKLILVIEQSLFLILLYIGVCCMLSGEIGVGFLVRCDHAALLQSGYKYKLDVSRLAMLILLNT